MKDQTSWTLLEIRQQLGIDGKDCSIHDAIDDLIESEKRLRRKVKIANKAIDQICDLKSNHAGVRIAQRAREDMK